MASFAVASGMRSGRAKNPLGDLPAPLVSDSLNAGATNQAFGKNYPTASGGDDTPALNSLLAAGQTDIQMRSGTYNLTSIAPALSNLKLRGAGIGRTTVITSNLTGNIIDLTGCSFCELSDFLIRPNAQRTAGAMVFLDAGAGSCQQNNLRRLSIASGFNGIQLGNCTLTVIEDIQILDTNAAWGWHSALYVSASAISCTVNRLRGGTAAGMTAGVVFLNGSGMDTFHGNDWDLASQSATQMLGVVLNGGTWSKFKNCSIESGAGGNFDALTMNGGIDTTFLGCHFLGRLSLNTGMTGTKIKGGEIIQPWNHGIALGGGVDTQIEGVSIADTQNSGFNAINVNAGVSDFSITNCDLGRNIVGGTHQFASLVNVAAGASDRYVIDLNRGRNYTGTALVDGGTGTNKRVGAVPTSNVFVP